MTQFSRRMQLVSAPVSLLCYSERREREIKRPSGFRGRLNRRGRSGKERNPGNERNTDRKNE